MLNESPICRGSENFSLNPKMDSFRYPYEVTVNCATTSDRNGALQHSVKCNYANPLPLPDQGFAQLRS